MAYLNSYEEAYSTIKVTVSIDYGGLKSRESHELVLSGGATAWDALNRVAKVNLLRTEGRDDKGQALLLEINGISKGNNRKARDWSLYLGKMRVPLGMATRLSLEDGTHATFKYEKIPAKPSEGEGPELKPE